MTCTGDVKVDDPKAGRHIEGQKAVYDLALRRMEITGDKVSMRDREGNRVQGRRVLYFVDDGKVEVKGKDDKPAVAKPAPAPAAGSGSGRG
jgi:lipopolysaccharide export system protein LptA